MKMQSAVRRAAFCLALSRLIIPFAVHAQNQVLGELQLVGKTKADKTSGVWVDGQYVGYVNELKSDNKILLLPVNMRLPFVSPGIRISGRRSSWNRIKK